MGWVQVRQQGGQNNELKPEHLDELNEREMKAQTEGFGIWNKASTKPLWLCVNILLMTDVLEYLNYVSNFLWSGLFCLSRQSSSKVTTDMFSLFHEMEWWLS